MGVRSEGAARGAASPTERVRAKVKIRAPTRIMAPIKVPKMALETVASLPVPLEREREGKKKKGKKKKRRERERIATTWGNAPQLKPGASHPPITPL
jgi:hypothetical protein